MSDNDLVHHCAPTLAGLKTGSLFTCPIGCREELLRTVRKTNDRLKAKGVRLLPLRFSEDKALIYLYRPKKLRADLSDAGAACILRRCGYDPSNWEKCLGQLGKKLRSGQEFPHEIGLFLGYPAEDVCGFMENSPCCKCVGCWKVYGDEEAARKKFAQYKKCTRVYRDRWAQGQKLEKLTVAG